MAKMSAPLFVHHEEFPFVSSPNRRTFWNQSWIVKRGVAFLCVGSVRGCQGRHKDQKKAKPPTGQCLQADRPWFRPILALPLQGLWPGWSLNPLDACFLIYKMKPETASFWAMVGINERMCTKDMAQGLLYTSSVTGAVFRASAQRLCWLTQRGGRLQRNGQDLQPLVPIRPQILLPLKAALKCVRWWLSLSFPEMETE